MKKSNFLPLLIVLSCGHTACNGKEISPPSSHVTEKNNIQINNMKENIQMTNEKLVQQLLDKSNLDKYFHADVLPERKPLILLKNNNTKYFSNLYKFDVPVIVMDKKEINKSNYPYLEINSLNTSEDKESKIDFSYAVEGIKGSVIFKLKDGKWEITDQEIIEH